MNLTNRQFYIHISETIPQDFAQGWNPALPEDWEMLQLLQKTADDAETEFRERIGRALTEWKSGNGYTFAQASNILQISQGQFNQWINKPREKRASIQTIITSMSKAGIIPTGD